MHIQGREVLKHVGFRYQAVLQGFQERSHKCSEVIGKSVDTAEETIEKNGTLYRQAYNMYAFTITQCMCKNQLF